MKMIKRYGMRGLLRWGIFWMVIVAVPAFCMWLPYAAWRQLEDLKRSTEAFPIATALIAEADEVLNSLETEGRDALALLKKLRTELNREQVSPDLDYLVQIQSEVIKLDTLIDSATPKLKSIKERSDALPSRDVLLDSKRRSAETLLADSIHLTQEMQDLVLAIDSTMDTERLRQELDDRYNGIEKLEAALPKDRIEISAEFADQARKDLKEFSVFLQQVENKCVQIEKKLAKVRDGKHRAKLVELIGEVRERVDLFKQRVEILQENIRLRTSVPPQA